jgi:hypothetical protein
VPHLWHKIKKYEVETVYKLKNFVTNKMLESVGFKIHKKSSTWYYDCAVFGVDVIYIPLEDCPYGNRIIQYSAVGSNPEDLLLEEIEMLTEKDWVEEI